MKFFIDTANLEQIREAAELGILDGVTTNPSLMAKEGIKGHSEVIRRYVDICNITDGDVSAEVLSTQFVDMFEEGIKLAELHKNIVVKVPMTVDGIKAIKKFSDNGIKTNCTLVFTAAQALLAAKAGATYVSPFVGRLDDISSDGISLISEIKKVYENYNFKTNILAASVRHTMHIMDCAKIGVDVVTCPLEVLKSLFIHPLTDAGLAKFIEDTKKFM
jgi:transaldolase